MIRISTIKVHLDVQRDRYDKGEIRKKKEKIPYIYY